jgi:hypothetical protein
MLPFPRWTTTPMRSLTHVTSYQENVRFWAVRGPESAGCWVCVACGRVRLTPCYLPNLPPK